MAPVHLSKRRPGREHHFLLVLLFLCSASCSSFDEGDGRPIPATPNDDSGDSESADDDEAVERAGASDELDTCWWVASPNVGTSVGTDFTVNCPASRRPIVGHCMHTGSAQLTDSHPFEASNASNLPEAGESWYSTSSTAGWRCAYDASVSAQIGVLCCGS